MKTAIIASVATVLVLPTLALAHGVQVQVTYNASANKVETREISRTSAPNVAEVTDLTRIFVMPVLPTNLRSNPLTPPQPADVRTYWYARPENQPNAANTGPAFPSGPGITWQYESIDSPALPANTQIPGTGWAFRNNTALPNLVGTRFTLSVPSALTRWDPATSTFAAPGSTSVQVLSGDGSTPYTQTVALDVTGSFVGGSLPLSVISPTVPGAASRPHSSITYRLATGGDPFGTAADGIYVLPLSVSTNALSPAGSAIGASDVYYLVLFKGGDIGGALAAAGAIASRESIPTSQIQVIPEPAAALTLLAPAALVMRRRR